MFAAIIMDSKGKIFRKIHYMNISDSGGDQIALVGKIKKIDRASQKLFIDVLGKEFEVNNLNDKQKFEVGNTGRR